MSRLVYKNLKNKLQNMYDSNIKINIGIYDDKNNIIEEKNIPLGNYLNDPLPSDYEKKITKSLSAKFAKV
tara:strand:- start:885 stop:1094 length:210 start_codon:yes stop_codon:yes gene_type:complete